MNEIGRKRILETIDYLVYSIGFVMDEGDKKAMRKSMVNLSEAIKEDKNGK